MADCELQSTLHNWPKPTGLQENCILGPKLMHHEGRAQTTVRVIFELIYDQPMHKTWKLRRLCWNPDCVNPHHWQPELTFRADGTTTVPLPPRTYAIRVASTSELPTDPEEVIDTVLMYEGGRDMTPEQLVEKTHGDYTIDDFVAALARIRAEGL